MLEQIPQGVYFVLGSQTDQLDDLPNSVQSALRQPARRIEMSPLSREAVRRINGKAIFVGSLSEPRHDWIFQLSAGHPLALVYLLKMLGAAQSSDLVEEALENLAPYRGKIEEYLATA